jgi:cytochrome c oxidase assembly protein subunit 11
MAVSAGVSVVVALGMLGLAFAADPIYDAFCRVTGYGGTTRVADAAPTAVLDRTIQVRFDSNVAPGLPLEMHPQVLSRTVRIGETALAFYTVRNTSDQPVTAVATYNVTPFKTGIYFRKLQCFCFQEQIIPAGESVDYAVVFFVDPELASDPETEEVQAITLSYTFFRSLDDAIDAEPQQAASATQRQALAQTGG